MTAPELHAAMDQKEYASIPILQSGGGTQALMLPDRELAKRQPGAE